MKIFTYLFFTFGIINVASAQTVIKGSQFTTWHMASSQKDVLYISDNEVVFPGTSKDQSVVVRMTKDGEEKWKVLIDGVIMGACKFHGNIIAFYNVDQKKSSDEAKIDKIFAMVISPEGKIIGKKEILTPDPSYYFVPEVHRDEAGEFKQLMLRYTRWNYKKSRTSDIEKIQTKSIKLYNVTKDVQAEETSDFGVNQDVAYIASTVSPNNDFLMFWFNKSNELVLEQFRDGSVNARLTLPSELKTFESFTLVHKVNKQGTAVLCAMNYGGSMIRTALFDFEKREVKKVDDQLTKAYRQQLEDNSEVVGNKKIIPGALFYQLQPIGVEFYKDQYIVIKEMRGVNKEGYAYGKTAVVSVLKNDLTSKKDFLIDKETVSNTSIPKLSYNVTDDKLQIVTTNRRHLSFTLLYGEVDLKQMKWIKLGSVKEAKGVTSTGGDIDTKAVIWSDKHVLVPQFSYNKSYTTVYSLQLVDLNQ